MKAYSVVIRLESLETDAPPEWVRDFVMRQIPDGYLKIEEVQVSEVAID